MKPLSTTRRLGSAIALCAAVAVLLSGCASFSADGGFSTAEQTAKERLGKDLRWARSDRDREVIEHRVTELLGKPLTADDAVQVALLNNRALQASFFELGIAEAELVQAARLPNPGFTSRACSEAAKWNWSAGCTSTWRVC